MKKLQVESVAIGKAVKIATNDSSTYGMIVMARGSGGEIRCTFIASGYQNGTQRNQAQFLENANNNIVKIYLHNTEYSTWYVQSTHPTASFRLGCIYVIGGYSATVEVVDSIPSDVTQITAAV